MSNNSNIQTVSYEYGSQNITLETGHIAKQATATVTVTVGTTTIIVPLVVNPMIDVNTEFLPLSVHLPKRNYAEGKIPTNHNRREGPPLDTEILTARIIDRSIRALFPKGFYHAVQLTPLIVSASATLVNDIPAMIGAAAALAISGLPCHGPIAAARVGYIEKKFVLNPTREEMRLSTLDLVVTAKEDAILMIEGDANALSIELILEAIALAHTHIKKAIVAITTLQQKVGKEKWNWEPLTIAAELEQKIKVMMEKPLKVLYSIEDKVKRKQQRDILRHQIADQLLKEMNDVTANQIDTLFLKIESQLMKIALLQGQLRIDKRDTRTIRPIDIQLGLLPRAHGSVLFTRGKTQALVTATLGTERDGKIVDGLTGEYRETFMLHYNFPPYCVGEIAQPSSPKRREIGHGNLAKRAMRAVLPDESKCPHVLRVVSDIMESDGSSSMATVCGASLALMDAGIPLKEHVAGIAMGLVKEGSQFVVLSDISEDEDHIGDMDLKVAATKNGITALQMDIKTDGITYDMLKAALIQATEGLKDILSKMEAALPNARENISPYAPQIISMQIPVDKIQALIGKGGTTIRAITTETGTLIDIQRDTGLIQVSASNATACQAAIEKIQEITASLAEPEIGVIYEGSVIRVTESGASVSILPNRRGYVHISEVLMHDPNQTIHDVLKEKQTIKVKVLDIDRQRNRIRLTMKGIDSEKDSPPPYTES